MKTILRNEIEKLEKAFNDRGLLIERMQVEMIKLQQRIESIEGKRIYCDICKTQSFGTKSAYNIHMRKYVFRNFDVFITSFSVHGILSEKMKKTEEKKKAKKPRKLIKMDNGDRGQFTHQNLHP